MCALEYTSIRDLTWNSYMTEEDMYNLKILYSPQPLSLPLLIEFNVFPLESSTRLQERRFCYSSSKGERICGYRRKLHIHWQHSQKLWKIVGKI